LEFDSWVQAMKITANMTYRGLIVVLIALSAPCFGAIAIIQHVHSTSIDKGSTVTCQLSSTGAGRNIIVGAAVTGQFGVGVVSVTDNQGNIYTQAPGSRGSMGSYVSEIWHSLGTVAGVTNVSVAFFVPPPPVPETDGYNKMCFAYEVSGAVTFDTAAKLSSQLCVGNLCTGASVTTATTTGFVLGVIVVVMDPIDQSPNAGNEFTSGGEIDSMGVGAAASLISSTAASHQPVWHISAVPEAFCTSTAAYRQ
jgi:hypothetical protein